MTRNASPYIAYRGIKFNIPLDARTPSYSDAGDSAQANIANVWEMNFWTEFLDEMARNDYNALSLWNLHPFPSMVLVPQYPNAALKDVCKTTMPLSPTLEGRAMSTPASLKNQITLKEIAIEEKIGFWQNVMRYGADRGIGFYLFTWNIFTYGTESSGYGFIDSIYDTKTEDYFRKSVKAIITTYPLLKGIGITAGENMSRDTDFDEAWLYRTYGQGINDALAQDTSRSFRLIHRTHFTDVNLIYKHFSALNPRCSLDLSYKYSMAHAYSSTRPQYTHANKGEQLDDVTTLRTNWDVGNADIGRDARHNIWFTIRDDDYYMFRGGSDPAFIREYIRNMPTDYLQGFFLGSDGYTWGREYISKESEIPHQLILKKRWYSFLLWGRLAYRPDTTDDFFVQTLALRFPDVSAADLFQAWGLASQVIPLVNRFHNQGCELDFLWYPEACMGKYGFHDVNAFIRSSPQSGEGMVSITKYARNVADGEAATGRTPVEVAEELERIACQTLKLADAIPVTGDQELSRTIGDIAALAYLGRYYAEKILGATCKCIATHIEDEAQKIMYQDKAIRHLQEASIRWQVYSDKVSRLYHHQVLSRLIPDITLTPGLPRYIDLTELRQYVDADIKLV
jgi:hypothetical protein